MYLIRRYGKILVHAGIYLNDNEVYHYATAESNVLKGHHTVKCSTLSDFAIGKKVYWDKVPNIRGDILKERIKRFAITNSTYNLFTNNCISFVLYCLSGSKATVMDMIRFALQHKLMLFSFIYFKQK